MTFQDIPGSGGGKASSAGRAAVEQIVVQIVSDASQFIGGVASSVAQAKTMLLGIQPAADQFEKDIALINATMAQTGEIGSASFAQVVQSLLAAGKISQETATTISTGITNIAGAEEEAAQSSGLLSGQFGTLIQTMLGFTAANFVIQLFQKLVGLINQTIDATSGLNLEQYRMQVALRATQREIGTAAGTTDEWNKFLEKVHAQFKIFTYQDLNAAAAKVMFLTRELGFNQAQMEEVTKSALILAEVNKMDVEEAARRLTYFLDTGMSRGLQTLGVQVNKQTVEQYAMAEGINKSWNEMSRQERAAISLQLVTQQTNRLMEDAGKITNTYAGQMQMLEAQQTDTLASMGGTFAAIQLAWSRAKVFFLQNVLKPLSDLFGVFVVSMTTLFSKVIATYAAVIMAAVNFKNDIVAISKGQFDELVNLSDQFKKDWQANFEIAQSTLANELFPKGLGDVADNELGSMANAFSDYGKQVEDTAGAVQKAKDQIDAAFADMRNSVADATANMNRDLDDLQIKIGRDVADAVTQLQQKFADIDTKYAQRRQDAITKAGQQIIDVQTSVNNDLAKSQEKYRANELDAQAKFDQRMREMQRQYLLDLQDAVRERDARAVLDLMRRHNVDVQNANEQFALQQQNAENNHKIEMQDIKRRGEERIRQINVELQRQLIQLDLEKKRERQKAGLAFVREMQDIALNEARRRQDILTNYNQRLQDLQRHLEDKLRLEAKGWVEEFNLTNKGAKAVYDTLKAYYGPKGYIVQLYQAMLAGIQAQQQAAGTPYTSQYNVQAIQAGGFATGGALLADKPTRATFGEGGPELAAFIPLNKLGDTLKSLGGGGGGAGGQGPIRIDLNVKTSDKLVVEVGDQVMNQVADVVTSVSEGR